MVYPTYNLYTLLIDLLIPKTNDAELIDSPWPD